MRGDFSDVGGGDCPPAAVGVDPAGVGQVLDVIQRRGAAAQVCLVRDGLVVLDRSFGCRRDGLFLLFSAGKPFIAVLVHLLAERGVLGLDDPVARYWPQFAKHGKDGITVRQVLQHRSGIPVARSLVRDALAAPDWHRSIRAIEDARPRWPAGQVPAYQVLSYGFILGEVIQRVTGSELREALQTQLLDPLALTDTHLGLPDSAWPQHVPVHGRGPGAHVRAAVFNRRFVRQAVIPAATMSSTARDLARFYQFLLSGGEIDGTRLLASATITAATRPSSDGEIDRFLQVPIRWSQGFQLGGPGADPTRPRPMGRRSNPDTFGHNGSNCCIGWADPRRGIVLAYLTDRLQPGLEGSPHLNDISDAILTACH